MKSEPDIIEFANVLAELSQAREQLTRVQSECTRLLLEKRELETKLGYYKEDAARLDSLCWMCASPDIEDPWRHEHGQKGPHWHHRIDPGDGLASDCKNSDMLERLFREHIGIAGALSQVREFNEKFGVQILHKPAIPDRPHQELRKSLLYEEYNELLQAWTDQHLAGIADGLADLIYVCIGTALAYGIPLGLVFDEVHRTNMLKTKISARDDGKILKPEGWKPPDITTILERARHA